MQNLAGGVHNEFGKGKTWLFGTFPSFRSVDGGRTRDYFARAFSWSGRDATVTGTEPTLIARLRVNESDGKHYLWIVNASREAKSGRFRVSADRASISTLETIRGTAKRIDEPLSKQPYPPEKRPSSDGGFSSPTCPRISAS